MGNVESNVQEEPNVQMEPNVQDESAAGLESTQTESEDRLREPHGSNRRYFKTYCVIQGGQKTHDTAILETALEHMTSYQVVSVKCVL